jgi:hypothetical protein
MKNISKWVLGAAVVAGALGLGANKAQAAGFAVYARGPVAYVPPRPGSGYVWIAGYINHGYWKPGRWEFRGRDTDRAVYQHHTWNDHFYRDRDDHRFDHDRFQR